MIRRLLLRWLGCDEPHWHVGQLHLTFETVEHWQRTAMTYGWEIGRQGGSEPDPLFDWSADAPALIADGANMGIDEETA